MNRHLIFTLKLALTVGMLYVVFSYVDVSEVWARIRSVNPFWLLASFLLLAFGYVLCGLRWAWISNGLGLPVSRKRKVRLYFLGMFASLFLPSTIGGDVVRGVLLAKGDGRQGMGLLAAASVILDRVNGLYALVLLITVSLLFFSWPTSWWLTWLSLAGAMWGGLFLFPWLHRRLSSRLPGKLAPLADLPLLDSRFIRQWWLSFPVSVVFQLLVVQVHVMLGMAVGLEISWPAFAIMVGLVALATTLPISLNGFGLREAGYVGFAVYFGGSGAAATAMAALWIIILAVTALPGAWVLWRLGGVAGLKNEKVQASE